MSTSTPSGYFHITIKNYRDSGSFAVSDVYIDTSTLSGDYRFFRSDLVVGYSIRCPHPPVHMSTSTQSCDFLMSHNLPSLKQQLLISQGFIMLLNHPDRKSLSCLFWITVCNNKAVATILDSIEDRKQSGVVRNR